MGNEQEEAAWRQFNKDMDELEVVPRHTLDEVFNEAISLFECVHASDVIDAIKTVRHLIYKRRGWDANITRR